MRLSHVLPGQHTLNDLNTPITIGVFTGEGIGSEVIPAALAVLDTLTEFSVRPIFVRHGSLIGKDAKIIHGRSLTDEAIGFCEDIFSQNGAILCGPGGERFVYELRACFDLFCKFTPLIPLVSLADTGVIRPEHLQDIDIVAVRENTGGLYFGDHGLLEDSVGGRSAYHHFQYTEEHVSRILQVAIDLAQTRRRRLSITTKPGGIPSISDLWADCALRLSAGRDVDVTVLEIDNAVYQLIANAAEFDVVVSPNMFGDVLADCGSLLIGSRGVSFSGNFSQDRRAVFQTGHGAAHDIAGKDLANPVGQILSLAMLLRESGHWEYGAAAIEAAVEQTLSMGYRTADIASRKSQIVGTKELTARICSTLKQHCSANSE
jgi:3-isopropylmalate dehydrogenase